MSKKETERYMRDEALPMIARYHALLQKNIEAGGTTLNRMDYDSIFNSKFARRVTDDPKEQEELMIAGQPAKLAPLKPRTVADTRRPAHWKHNHPPR